MTRPDDSVEDKGNTLGPPMPHVEVKIIDPETGDTLPLGTMGEYCTRGYHVMHEYFEMKDATAETIDAEGWLHTGDIGEIDREGYLTLKDRKKHISQGGKSPDSRPSLPGK